MRGRPYFEVLSCRDVETRRAIVADRDRCYRRPRSPSNRVVGGAEMSADALAKAARCRAQARGRQRRLYVRQKSARALFGSNTPTQGSGVWCPIRWVTVIGPDMNVGGRDIDASRRHVDRLRRNLRRPHKTKRKEKNAISHDDSTPATLLCPSKSLLNINQRTNVNCERACPIFEQNTLRHSARRELPERRAWQI
jgi:hypothetical protein